MNLTKLIYQSFQLHYRRFGSFHFRRLLTYLDSILSSSKEIYLEEGGLVFTSQNPIVIKLLMVCPSLAKNHSKVLLYLSNRTNLLKANQKYYLPIFTDPLLPLIILHNQYTWLTSIGNWMNFYIT